jgi:hypothetical protein
MLLERTISQLDIGYVPPEQAHQMGQLGYMQWLGALPGNAGYPQEAARAYAAARPFLACSPAIAVFCQLLLASVAAPCAPLPLRLPEPCRRGGARARRLSL